MATLTTSKTYEDKAQEYTCVDDKRAPSKMDNHMYQTITTWNWEGGGRTFLQVFFLESKIDTWQ